MAKKKLFLTGPTREIPSGQNGPILGGGGGEFEVGRVAPESEKQMQIGQVLPSIFIPYTYLGSKKKTLAIILAFKKSVIFLKSGRKSCSEKLLQLRRLR